MIVSLRMTMNVANTSRPITAGVFSAHGLEHHGVVAVLGSGPVMVTSWLGVSQMVIPL